MGSKSVEREVVDLCRRVDRPVITTSDVQEAFGISQQAAYGRLSNLVTQGVLNREKVGSRAVVWWLREGYDSE